MYNALMAYPAFVILLALILYSVTIFNVGRAREKFGVKAPATNGVSSDFDRYYRVQMNTLEQLVLFIPSLWLFAKFVNPMWASFLGLIWVLGRALYAVGYYQEAKKRAAGFGISLSANIVLLIGAIAGVVNQMF